jgi:multiple sugar transport system ATP-binding protein
MATLELQGVTKRFGETVACAGIDLRIKDNEFFCIFGPPSCGKTTLLRLFLGLIVPSEGTVLIDGKDVTYARPDERDLGMVFQNLALFPHLTAFGNIAFPLSERKVPKAQIAKRVAEVAEKLHITHIIRKLPAHLSGGERQRVAIARALVRDPKAFLMDEPIAALDARLRETTRVELKRLQRELKHTLVYVTHDQEEAMSIADRIAVMREGRIAQVGSPDEIYNRPNSLFVAQMVGSPRINVLRGRLAGGRFLADSIDWQTDVPNVDFSGAADLAIRPEDLAIWPGGKPGMLAGEVFEVEPLGGHTVVDVSLGEEILRVHLPGQPELSPGQAVGLEIDGGRCHLFSQESGEAVRHAS